jgi:hypothetical protein
VLALQWRGVVVVVAAWRENVGRVLRLQRAAENGGNACRITVEVITMALEQVIPSKNAFDKVG